LKQPRRKLPQPISSDVRNELPQPAQDYIDTLENELKKAIQEIDRLQGLLLMNSLNSSKPPSSDGLTKPLRIPGSQRGRTGKKPGGQPQHSGTTLQRHLNPDQIFSLPVDVCKSCGENLASQEAFRQDNRQCFDLPSMKISIIEYQGEAKLCPCCSDVTASVFPLGVDTPVGYGPNLKGFSIYLMHSQLIPPRRVAHIWEELLGHSISPGSIMNWSQFAYETLDGFEKSLVAEIIASEVVNFDETGMRSEGKLHWLHSASTCSLSFFGIHKKRGREAMEHFGILTQFRGVAVHDHWDSYFTFEDCTHSLCNSHILRELKFLEEVMGEKWAGKVRQLLTLMHKKVELQKGLGHKELSWEVKTDFFDQYAAILNEGFDLHRPQQPDEKQSTRRGRKKQSKGKNLLDRLCEFNGAVLRFLTDFRVPFTNNQSEQDIRMNKVKMKISGCFRSARGASAFCRIRSYISTMQKQGRNVAESCQAIFRHEPYLLIR